MRNPTTIEDDLLVVCRSDYIHRYRNLADIARDYAIDYDALKTVADLNDWKGERALFVEEAFLEARDASKRQIVSMTKLFSGVSTKMLTWANQELKVKDGIVEIDADNVHRVLRTLQVTQASMNFLGADPAAFATPSKKEDESTEHHDQYLQLLRKKTGKAN